MTGSIVQFMAPIRTFKTKKTKFDYGLTAIRNLIKKELNNKNWNAWFLEFRDELIGIGGTWGGETAVNSGGARAEEKGKSKKQRWLKESESRRREGKG